MEFSKYNFIYPLKSSKEYIYYNSCTNSLVILDEEEYNSIYTRNMDSKFQSQLYELGFLIDSSISEEQAVVQRMFNSRFQKESLNLTIAVTADCNFRCSYCYEKKSNTEFIYDKRC